MQEAALRVLVVDDSSFARKIIAKMLAADPELQVVGEAEDGHQAMKMARDLRPDVILLDLIMPDPDGLWIVQNVIKRHPIPIVLFSAVTEANSDITKEAFQQGVLDVVKKPENPGALGVCRTELISKIKAAGRSKSTFQALFRTRDLAPATKTHATQSARSAIAIVASAGSPAILNQLIRNINQKRDKLEIMNMAILVALHIPREFLDSFTKAVSEVVTYPVHIAKEGDIIRRNSIYFSPADKTMCVKKTNAGAVVKLENMKIKLQPHFDAFLESIAETFGKKTIAVVLSGMGNHGLEGVRAIKKSGGKAIVQNPSTAGVAAMPQAVLDEGLADESLKVPDMAEMIALYGNLHITGIKTYKTEPSA